MSRVVVANQVYALVSSKDDLAELIPKVKEYFNTLEGYKEEATPKRTVDPETGVVTRHTTIEVQEAASDADDLMYELMEFLKTELESIRQELFEIEITRPEEQRRFKIFKNKLKYIYDLIERHTEDYRRFDVEDDFEKYYKTVVKGLEFLHKYWHRYEHYTQEIPKSWEHGPFTIVNNYGFQPEEAEPVMALLDVASKAMRDHGFEELVYGKVVLTTKAHLNRGRKKGNWPIIGVYVSLDDMIYIAVDYDPGKHAVKTILHEWGHRLWAHFLSEETKARYVESFGYISKDQLRGWWDIIEQSDYNLRQALKHIDPKYKQEVQKRFRAALNYVVKYMALSAKMIREEMLDSPSGAYARQVAYHFTRETEVGDYYKPKVLTPHSSITHYGLTNPEEDFCEVFAYYCLDQINMDKAEGNEVWERFEEAVRSLQK